MTKASPTQRALAECRRLEYEAQIVEKWNPHSMTRHDLFGCIDIVALAPRGLVCLNPYSRKKPTWSEKWQLLGIQVTSASNHAARKAKALAEPRIAHWVAAGAAFEVWSYAKKGKAGARKLWTLRRERIEFDVETQA